MAKKFRLSFYYSAKTHFHQGKWNGYLGMTFKQQQAATFCKLYINSTKEKLHLEQKSECQSWVTWQYDELPWLYHSFCQDMPPHCSRKPCTSGHSICSLQAWGGISMPRFLQALNFSHWYQNMALFARVTWHLKQN